MLEYNEIQSEELKIRRTYEVQRWETTPHSTKEILNIYIKYHSRQEEWKYSLRPNNNYNDNVTPSLQSTFFTCHCCSDVMSVYLIVE